MNHLRPATILLSGGLFLALVAPSCTTAGDDDAAASCPRGNRGCRCKSDDSCNAGLSCNDDGKCVGAAGQGGSAGAATAGGAGRANGGRAGTESFARAGSHSRGGTSGDAGAAGDNGTGAVVGRGTGGSGNTTGQAGEGALAGEAGAAASGGTGGSGNSGGRGGSAGKAGSGNAGGPACSPITLTTLTVNEDNVPDMINSLSIFAPNVEDLGMRDQVALQLYDNFGGMDYSGGELGTFELGTGADADFETCSRCLVLVTDAVGDNPNAKWFFASEGTLTFANDSDQMNALPHGTLRDVVLREATYDPSTYQSTFVDGGACYTLANGDLLVNYDGLPVPPVGWTCDLEYWGDTKWCDCGCGVHDPDCGTEQKAECEYCYCNPSDDADCSAVASAENQTCSL